MLNGIEKGFAVTTCGNRKLQVDAFKKVLGLSHVRDANARDDDINFSSNLDFDATRDSSFADNNNNSSSLDSTKGFSDKKFLPDKYFI